ncbi:MAG: sensor domain-containing diguanylate cyclase [Clostridia bacterium]
MDKLYDDRFYKIMLNNTYEGIYFVDANRNITFWNKGAEKISGFTATEVLGRNCSDNILNHIDDFGTRLCINGCPLHKTLEDGLYREASVYLHHKNGTRVPINIRIIPVMDGDKIIGAAELFNDDAEKHKLLLALDNFKVLALKDQLTGLANRRYIEYFLESKISDYKRMGIPFGIALFDIDNFKPINDNYGHIVGDELLQVIAKTISNVTRSTDLTGRWGGDEFISIFTGAEESALHELAEKIRNLILNSKLRKGDKEVSVSVSIGVTPYKEGDTIDSIAERADELLYKSKRLGKNRTSS